MKRKAKREKHNDTNGSLPKAKIRKYDQAHVALGFTLTMQGDEEKQGTFPLLLPSKCGLCLLCQKNVGSGQNETK